MLQRSLPLLAAILLLCWSQVSWARLGGIESGGCAGCHVGGAPATVTVTADSMSVVAGQKVTITIGISTTNGRAGGFYIPRPAIGTFTATAGTRVWPDGGITHSTPARTTGNQVIFQVIWTAPSQPTMGGADFPVYALSANGNGNSQGDGEGDGFLSIAYGCGAGTKYYLDNDGDGYGGTFGWTLNCSPPKGYVAMPGDCDDNDPTVYPGAPEICDGKDNNCNGQIDEGLANLVLCEDKDGDGHGILGGATHTGCTPHLKGFGLCDGDCNDSDPTVYPGAPEICDGKDNNCNGQVDEGVRPTCGVGWCRRYAPTCDGKYCMPGPPRPEECNLLDDDCDGVVDNGTDLQLCGVGKACRTGYCVPFDGGSDTGAGDPGATPGTGSADAGGAAMQPADDAGGAAIQPPDFGKVTCAMGRRVPREGSGWVALLISLGWIARATASRKRLGGRRACAHRDARERCSR